MKRCFLIGMLLAGLLASGTVRAENKLRTDELFWDSITSEHFTIVFPVGMLTKARQAAFYLEGAYTRIGHELKTPVLNTITVVLYGSHNRFEQTNIMSGPIPEQLYAFAETYQDRIVLPVDASRADFQYLLEHELTHIFEFAALFPRRIPSFYIIRFPFYPVWLVEGLAEYAADPDPVYRKMLLRDRALDNRLIPMKDLFGFAHMNPHETEIAYKQSGEFFRYLATLDADNPRRVLAAFRKHMPWKIDSVIRTVFNADLQDLNARFRQDLIDRSQLEVKERSEPPPFRIVSPADEGYYHTFETDAVWSDDGTQIAFFSDRGSTEGLYIAAGDGSGAALQFRLRMHMTIEGVHRSQRGNIAWGPGGTDLVFAGEWGNTARLYHYDRTLDKLNSIDLDFDEIRDIDFSPKGTHLVFSGVRNGVSDIYTYHFATAQIVQITNDPYDDRSPTWSAELRAVVYSSERRDARELIILDMEADDPKTTEEVFLSTPGNDTAPAWNRQGDRLAFVSDMDGFYDIYVIDVRTRDIFRQTRFKGGAFQPRFAPDGKSLLFTYFRNGRYALYTVPVVMDETVKMASFPQNRDVIARRVRYADGQAGDETAAAFRSRLHWDMVLPLGIFNMAQLTDTLGNHQIDGAVYPYFTNQGTVIGADLMYWNRSTRWDFGAGIRMDTRTVTDKDERTDDTAGVFEARYPFDVYRSITGGILAGTRREYDAGSLIDEQQRLGGYFSLTHDSRFFRGINHIAGIWTELGAELYPGRADSTDLERYGYAYGAYSQAIEVSRDHVVLFSLTADISAGRDRNRSDLADLVRGYALGEVEGYGRMGIAVEYRFPLTRDADYAVMGHYLLLKDVRGFAFIDYGAVSNSGTNDFLDELLAFDLEMRYSMGMGIQVDFYGMQRLPAVLRVGFASVGDKYAVRSEKAPFFLSLSVLF